MLDAYAKRSLRYGDATAVLGLAFLVVAVGLVALGVLGFDAGYYLIVTGFLALSYVLGEKGCVGSAFETHGGGHQRSRPFDKFGRMAIRHWAWLGIPVSVLVFGLSVWIGSVGESGGSTVLAGWLGILSVDRVLVGAYLRRQMPNMALQADRPSAGG